MIDMRNLRAWVRSDDFAEFMQLVGDCLGVIALAVMAVGLIVLAG